MNCLDSFPELPSEVHLATLDGQSSASGRMTSHPLRYPGRMIIQAVGETGSPQMKAEVHYVEAARRRKHLLHLRS
ncbi:MAG: hypothetical protein GXP35_04485 [Actinobacteria bacterium]|nr:hypothetical protein [Actinomycetota bacterium]